MPAGTDARLRLGRPTGLIIVAIEATIWRRCWWPRTRVAMALGAGAGGVQAANAERGNAGQRVPYNDLEIAVRPAGPALIWRHLTPR